MRTETIDAVAVTGGHRSGAGLGVIELTVALALPCSTRRPTGIVRDVGHQAYPHKILTGRRDRIRTLRMGNGLSGFTKRAEREATTRSALRILRPSISAALGMAVARDLSGGKNNVIAVIGDGAMTAGMAYEAMNNAGAMNSRLIVILNGNDMSIAPPVGAMAGYLARLFSGHTLSFAPRDRQAARQAAAQGARDRRCAPRSSAAAWSPAARCSRSSASTTSARSTATTWTSCLPVLKNVRDSDDRPDHRSPPHPEGQRLRAGREVRRQVSRRGQVRCRDRRPGQGQVECAGLYQKVFGESLIKEAKKDDKIVGITAAMPSGTGIDQFEKVFPERTSTSASPSSTP